MSDLISGLGNLFSPNFGLLLAVAAGFTAYFQWQKVKEEGRAYRQQLITLLHHAEAIKDSLASIGQSSRNGKFSSANDVAAAVESIEKNAEALFLGLIETKVGGTSIKDELDEKYKEWADLELEYKMMVKKDLVKNYKFSTQANHLQRQEQTTNNLKSVA